MADPTSPDRLDVIRLAAAAGCDPRTARAFLIGEQVRGDLLRGRLRQAATSLGLVAVSRDASRGDR